MNITDATIKSVSPNNYDSPSILHSEPASALSLLTVWSHFACGIHPAAQSAIGKQQWVTGFHCV